MTCGMRTLTARFLGQRGVRSQWRTKKASHALIFLACLLLIGLVIVLMMKQVVFWLALLSLVFVGLYPLAKRVTHWPQAMLGLTFNFGALMGASAVLGVVPVWALVLYAGCFLWTIGYDTIYAHQDREDDISVGVKSTALLFGEKTKPIIRALYVGAVLAWGCALWLAWAGVLAWMGLIAAAATGLASAFGRHSRALTSASCYSNSAPGRVGSGESAWF